MADKFTFNHDAFNNFVNQPGGPVAQALMRFGNEVAIPMTFEHLNVQHPNPTNPGRTPTNVPYRRTGALQRSLRAEEMVDADGVMVGVVSDVEYAYWLMEGPPAVSQEFDLVPPALREFRKGRK